MKKTLFALTLVVMLLSLTFATVGAGEAWDDPKLCVNGEWLLVIAAKPSAVKVYVPDDARYGNQRQGGCKTPGPNVPLITNVVERGDHNWMLVVVDGKLASTPTVTANYGRVSEVRRNNGKGSLNFLFRLR
ncbi:MAG: hypothetical protein HY868_07145 [Chloroflexi bacterium]|nr:hypothetical protein [Chloroflexota bacterium]